MPPQHHAEVLDVPQDRNQGSQVVEAEHEVKTAEVDAEAGDGEVLLANGMTMLQATVVQGTQLPLATLMRRLAPDVDSLMRLINSAWMKL